MISLFLSALPLAVLVWVTYTFTRAYSTAEGAWYQRALAAGKGSATVLWAQLVIFATGFVELVGTIADVIDPGSAESVKAVLPTQYVAAFTVALMLVTIMARLRTLGK